jgi:hypothetical protein
MREYMNGRPIRYVKYGLDHLGLDLFRQFSNSFVDTCCYSDRKDSTREVDARLRILPTLPRLMAIVIMASAFQMLTPISFQPF